MNKKIKFFYNLHTFLAKAKTIEPPLAGMTEESSFFLVTENP